MLTWPSEVGRHSARTGDLETRRKQHARDPELKDYKFEVDRLTDDYAQQRGREQVIHDKYKPPLNKKEPIAPKNPKREEYLDAAKKIE